MVRPQIEFAIVIDQTEANAIQPTYPPEQVLIDSFVAEKIDHRLNLKTEDVKPNDMSESLNASSHRSKNSMLAGFDLQFEQFAVLTLKKAAVSSGVNVSDEGSHFAAAFESHPHCNSIRAG
jgi:hypothetical protein